ncbi:MULTISPECIES: hypothetical protein [unclassified Streptomyces]|uniref:hypothetical protein n=1 Tax=unclassified Streptomyces TaxID=2593676 RepID=UPI002271FC4D|nr:MULTISPECIES: hypothetical protein [unclassified Streptomyces]MCY0924175.1 hypothetical protein [Streptomyces sp. H27-G5]MCY0963362.1 hypothetical protein [Streptomyces sp. H27-H5]
MNRRTWEKLQRCEVLLVEPELADVKPEQVETHLPPPYPGRNFFGSGSENAHVGILRLKLSTMGSPAIDRALGPKSLPVKASEWLSQLTDEQEWDERIETACVHYQLLLGLRGRAVDGIPDEFFWNTMWRR